MNPIASKILSLFTGGLPKEIANQIGGHLERKSNELVEMLKVTSHDKLFTRQGIAWTFHLFMWGHKIWKGHFPQDTIFQWGDKEVTIGLTYCIIIAFYFPFRAMEKWKKIL